MHIRRENNEMSLGLLGGARECGFSENLTANFSILKNDASPTYTSHDDR